MPVFAPTQVAEAVAVLSSEPEAHLLAGGTDLMVEVNFGHRRPATIVRLDRIDALAGIEIRHDEVEIGAMVTYRALTTEPIATLVPALAQAARTVGSPQIRNAGTIGGNVATASPAGDTLPVLVALDARVRLAGPNGERRVPIGDYFTGPKRSVRAADEVIVSVTVPRLRGAQEFLKVGTRNAMVIAVASVAVIVDRDRANLRVGLGSVGPTPLRAPAAEQWAAAQLDWGSSAPATAEQSAEFGNLVAAAASPIDDQRSIASYRRHAVAVCAARALRRVTRAPAP